MKRSPIPKLRLSDFFTKGPGYVMQVLAAMFKNAPSAPAFQPLRAETRTTMKLNSYARPPADSGRGIHWSPSQYQWGRHEWDKWQKRLLDMNIKWVKINIPTDYNADALVKRLTDLEIMPVCRFIRKNPSRIGGSVEKTIERLVKLGARYFETNNEPDADVEWKGFRRPAGWEELVIKNLIYDANRLFNLGAYPAFVAFNCGPTENRNPIQILLDTPGGADLFEQNLWVSLHNYGKGRPVNYPNDRVRMFGDPVSEDEWLEQGQPSFWTEQDVTEFVWHNMTRENVNKLREKQANPAVTIMTDITGFRAYEYWHQLITQAGLPAIPIMMTEGGWETGDRLDPFYPEPTAQRASDLNLQMFRFVQGDIELDIFQPDGQSVPAHVPDYLFAVMPWHMGEREFGRDTSGQWEQGAWFTHWHDKKFGLKGELPIVQMLRDLPPTIRRNGPVPPEWGRRRRKPDVAVWDHRLPYLGDDGIGVEKTTATGPRWELTAGLWQDKNEVNPKQAMPPGYIMVQVQDARNKPVSGVKTEIRRKDNDTGADIIDYIFTKGEFDRFMGNYRMTGALGAYTITVVQDNYPADKILGVGLGGEFPGSKFDTTSFLFVFRLAGVPVEPEPTPTTPDAGATRPATAAEPLNEADHLGVTITPAKTPPACDVIRVSPAANLAPHTLYIDVLTAAGDRAFGATALVKSAAGRLLRVPIEKPAGEPGGNMPMWPENVYTIVGVEWQGKQLISNPVSGLQSEIPGYDGGHSFLVELQLR